MGVVRGDNITLSDGCPHTPGIAIDTRLSIIKSLPVSYMRREVKGHAYYFISLGQCMVTKIAVELLSAI